MFASRMPDHRSPSLDFALEIDFSGVLTNPILDIAARVWEPSRYEAFQVCYRSMRRIDDLVDDLKAEYGAVPSELAVHAEREIALWLGKLQAGSLDDDYGRLFLATIQSFAIPLWPWERLGQAMVFDLQHEGFANFHVFLRYCEGAAISPAAVFMQLCGVRQAGEKCDPPKYDIRKAARELAIFSYLTHIMRDYEKDQKAGLNYFADSILRHAGITAREVRELAESEKVDGRLREVFRIYHATAKRYQQKARAVVDSTLVKLEPRYQLSLELIFALYSQIFERINPATGGFGKDELNPSPAEVAGAVQRTIERFRPVEGSGASHRDSMR